jgi:SSS family transporter
VGWLFVPIYHRLRLTSAYEYLEQRFDRRLRRAGSLLYGLYVLSWMGTMLYATSLIVQAALGLDEGPRVLTMVILGAVTVTYTTVGGFQAAVWTNVFKAAILAAVIVAILLLAVARVEGGLAGVWEAGREHDKFSMFRMEFDLTKRANFFSACAFGMFVYLAVGVTGQTAVQRYVSMPTVAAARRSLVVNGLGTAGVCFLFFLLGTAMFAFYAQHPAAGAAAGSVFPPLLKEDHITIHFVRTELPYPGLLGLLLGALFTTVMGSVSSGLSGLSSLVASDWLDGQQLGVRLSRWLSALFGVATLGMALVVPYLGKHVFDIIMRLSGALFGPLLGLFLLGALVPRANAAGAAAGLLAGLVSLALVFPTEVSSWWYGALTCLPTLLVGFLASLLFPPPAEDKVRGCVVSRRGTFKERPAVLPPVQAAEPASRPGVRDDG